jgi:hypothetical protein
MSLTQCIPELESSPEARDAPETASEGSNRGRREVPPEQEGTQRRLWLYRFFFGP